MGGGFEGSRWRRERESMWENDPLAREVRCRCIPFADVPHHRWSRDAACLMFNRVYSL